MMDGFFFDCRYIRVGHHDGISRFSASLFSAVSKIMDVTAVISDLRQLEKLPGGTKFLKVSAPTSILEPLVSLQLNRAGAKIVFSPMQTIGSFGRKFKLILTVHDLIYYRHPSAPPSFSLPIRVLWRLYHLMFWPQRVLLNRSDAVVTVSNTTKALIEKNRLTKRPIRVIYNAPEVMEIATSQTAKKSQKRSLVYMGSFMDYKNVEVLIRGMQFLPNFELNLLSKISPARKAQLEGLIPKSAKVIFHNGVSEEKYHELLEESMALVSGSKDEGFGIPLVEAMSRGIPIVVSDIGIFREIGGDAGIYFDSEDPESFASSVASLNDTNDWQTKSSFSKIQALKFNWNDSAIALKSLLEQI
jgi:glycosyltransferase involved in cell wall biosynthesis